MSDDYAGAYQILDLAQLSSYIGEDAPTQAQFLQMAQTSLVETQTALNLWLTQSPWGTDAHHALYRALHAAKPLVTMVSSTPLQANWEQLCDTLCTGELNQPEQVQALLAVLNKLIRELRAHTDSTS